MKPRGREDERERRKLTEKEKKETRDFHSYSKSNRGFRSLVKCHLPDGDFLNDSI